MYAMIYNGKKYYQHSRNRYWVRDERAADGKRKLVLLHRVIWEDAHGTIQDGRHIHHIDGCRTNNLLENLECISPGEHASIHRRKEAREGRLGYLHEAQRRALSTPEGRKRKSESVKTGWKTRKEVKKECKRCGKEFLTQAPQRKWCGQSCKFKNWWHKEKSNDPLPKDRP